MEYRLASAARDHPRMHSCLVNFLAIPGAALVKKRGGKLAGGAAKRISKQLRAVLANLSQNQGVAYPRFSPPQDAAPLSPDLQAISRCTELVRNGFFSRAAKALTSQPPLDPEAMLDALDALHPNGPAAIPPKPLLAAPPIHVVEIDSLRDFIRRHLANGAAPGPSGWTGELLLDLAHDTDCLSGLASIMADVQSGVLQPQTSLYLLASREIGVPKANGQPRPIAVGEALYKLAAMHKLDKNIKAVRQVLGHMQLGVGVKNACESIVHMMQAMLDNGNYVMSLDFANAFNEANRAAMMSALFSHPQLADLFDISHWAYSSPSPLFIMSRGKILRTIWSKQGSRQGDPLGGVLFALALQPALVQAAAASNEVTVRAFYDNVHVAGPPEPVVKVTEVLVAEAARIGLRVQYHKSELLAMKDDPHPEAVNTFIDQHNIPVENQAGIVLGVPVGRNENRIKELLSRTMAEQSSFFRLLKHEKLQPVEAVLLLRYSMVPRMSYLSRCVAPDLILPEAKRFDCEVQATFCSKIRVTEPAYTLMARQQTELPLRLAGYGLRSAAATSPFAWLGAVASVAPSLSVINPTPERLKANLRGVLATTRAMLRLAADAQRSEPAANIDRPAACENEILLLPASHGEALEFYSHQDRRVVALKLQKTLTKIAEQAVFDRMKASASSPAAVARLVSQSGPMASAWKGAVPLDKSLHLEAKHFRLAVLYSLGLPIRENLPTICGCGHNVRGDAEHILSCCIFQGQLVIVRHNELERIIHYMVRRLGGSSTIEPQRLVLASGKHPDLELLLGAIRYLLDVTIVTPRTGPLEAAECAANHKSNHYRDLAASCRATFIPFPIETYGAWGDQARSFAKILRDFNDERLTGLTKREVYYRFCTEIAVAVQRGNARVMEAWTQVASDREQLSFSAADRSSVAI